MIFATRGRTPLIADDWRPDLHRYLGAVLGGLGGTSLGVGGIADHVHILAALRTTHAVADVVRELKKSSSAWASERCPGFGWQVGYAALSVGVRETPHVQAYIARQEDHHRVVNSADELRRLLREHGVDVDVRYFE